MAAALELQINTQRAQQALRQVERSIDHLRTTLDRMGTGLSGWDAFVTRLSGFRGIDPAVVNSLQTLQRTLSTVGRTSNLSELNRQLSSLSRVASDRLASGVQRLANALASIRIPQGLTTLANTLQQISRGLQTALPLVRSFRSEVSQIRVPADVRNMADALRAVQRESANASRAVFSFRNALSAANGVLATFGIYRLSQVVRSFATSMYETHALMVRFNALMQTVSKTQEEAAGHWDYVRKLAWQTGVELQVLTHAYAKFGTAVMSMGIDAEDTRTLFTALTGSARVLGLTTEQTRRYFLAFEQVMTKGSIQAEELKRQMGDIFPAFQILADSMGISGKALMDAMRSGSVGANHLLDLIKGMVERYGPGMESMAVSVQAAVARLNQSVMEFKKEFAEGWEGPAQKGIEALARAMQSTAFKEFARDAGTVAGILTSALANALTWVVRNWDWLKWAIQGVLGLGVAAAVNRWIAPLLSAGSAIAGMTGYVKVAVALMPSLGIGGTMFMLLKDTAMLAVTAFRAVWVALGPVGLAITALTVAVPALWTAYQNLTKATDKAVDSSLEHVEALKQQDVDTMKAKLSTVELESAHTDTGKSYEELTKKTQGATQAFETQWTYLDTLIAQYHRAKRAAEQLAEAQDKLKDSVGGSGGSGSADSFSGGGIVGRGSGRTQRAPVTAWFGAPMAAGGMANTSAISPTLPGNGIPIIAHPNEAVVPLTGGGAIPVESSQQIVVSTAGTDRSGGRFVSQMLKLAYESVDALHDIHIGVVRTWESVNHHALLMQQEWSLHFDAMETLIGKAIEIDKSLVMVNDKLFNVLNEIERAAATRGESYESTDIEGFNQAGPRQSLPTWFNPPMKDNNPFKKNPRLLVPITIESSDVKGLATGSPNASKDGFPVILHPDEAVIPLPDGRRVPVQMPDGFSSTWQRLNRFMEAHDWSQDPPSQRTNKRVWDWENTAKESTDSRHSSPTININMTVNAQDASSFAVSKKQIMQELQAELDRALRNLGKRSKYEDPTRRRA